MKSWFYLTMDRNFLIFFFVLLFTKIEPSVSINLEASLKMAQCRAHCLNKFGDIDSSSPDQMCKERSDCFGCWQTCEKLSSDYPIWSFNCGQKTRCDSGCQSACDFLAAHKDVVVPLSSHNSRLTLIFGGTSAQWSLVWGPEVPPQRAVFALFTRSSGRPWKLRDQTAEYGALLEDVSSGTELKLVAVAESGLLSVIITPFDPPGHRKGLGSGHFVSDKMFPWNKDSVVKGDKEKGWPLLYEASVQDSGLVAARVWWSTQRPFGSDYLVTWEVAGGGLKGHLYTDLPEVDLTLWPETVYKVQVEVVTGPLGEPRTSQLLILDTHNITFEAQSHSQSQSQLQKIQQPIKPIVKPVGIKMRIEIIVGGVIGALVALAVVFTLIFRIKCTANSNFNDSSSSNSKLTLNRSISDLTFEESLVKGKSSPTFPGRSSAVYSVPYPTMGPQNTIGIPSSYPHFASIHCPSVRGGIRSPDISII